GTGGIATIVNGIAAMRILGVRRKGLPMRPPHAIDAGAGVAALQQVRGVRQRIIVRCTRRASLALERTKAGIATLSLRAKRLKLTKAAVRKAVLGAHARSARLVSGLASYLTAKLGWASPNAVRYHRSRWLHTNACGDFTLLAREDWARLRGYAEWPIFSWHL